MRSFPVHETGQPVGRWLAAAHGTKGSANGRETWQRLRRVRPDIRWITMTFAALAERVLLPLHEAHPLRRVEITAPTRD